MDSPALRQVILNLPNQLSADLAVLGREGLVKTDKFILCGMGGSALAGGLLRTYAPTLDLLLHRDYGLPRVPDYFLNDSLLILSSYSGHTEEVLDTLRLATAKGLKVAVLTSGGELLKEAERLNLPRVVLPAGLPPRFAVGYAFVGLAQLLGHEAMLTEARQAATLVNPVNLEAVGQGLARSIDSKIPIIYASTVNLALAYQWKISFNETGKIPAFANVLPEANHNELAASDPHFIHIFLRDPADDERVKRRFEVLKEMFRAQGVTVLEVELAGASALAKIFNAVTLASWTAYYCALAAHRDPVNVPTIEEFKARVKVTS